MRTFSLKLILIFLAGVFIGAIGVVVYLRYIPDTRPKTIIPTGMPVLPDYMGGRVKNVPLSTESGDIRNP